MASVISGDANVSATEFGYLDGVTSALQTQMDAKFATPGAWTSWTPTIEGYAGTLGTVSGISAAYAQVGKLIIARLTFNVASQNTATTGITFTLPVTSVATSSGHGTFTETNVNSWICHAYNYETGKAFLAKYDGGFPISGSNNKLVGIFTYEAA